MKILLTIFLTATLNFAATLTYKVKAPLFGEVGKVEINYYTNSKNYEINAKMQTYGFAKKLSGNRKEKYYAKGFIKGNTYKAKHFIQDATYKNKVSHLEYIFDYKAKKIFKIRKKTKSGKVTTNYKKVLNYFTYNDLFSVYHNIVTQLKNKPSGYYQVKAAGVEKNNGNLQIIVPPKSKQLKEAKSMGVGNVWTFHIITGKKILGSKNGEIIFAVGDDGVAKAVRVLNIPFVSHLDAILVR
jgi:hypothetical protein